MNMPKPTWESPCKRVRLFLGDAEKVLPALEGIGCLCIDPPYEIERFKKGSLRFDKDGKYPDGLTWDRKPSDLFFAKMLTVGKTHIIWGANNFRLPPSPCFFVWNKCQTVANFADAELAWCDAEGVTAKVFTYSIHKHNQVAKFHPTQKPVELMAWCLEQARIPKDTVVCDCYAGSGSTGVACIQTGRQFVGIERDPTYFADMVKRLQQELTRGRLLFGPQRARGKLL
jgi:hypothetical protein